MDLFSSQWVPPWVSQSTRARGTVFTSNIGVAEYFRLVHGFTRSDWLEELARYEAAKAQQATQRQTYTYRQSHYPGADEYLRLWARSAFVSYCQSYTNISEQIKQH